jgi:hypothetical protein
MRHNGSVALVGLTAAAGAFAAAAMMSAAVAPAAHADDTAGILAAITAEEGYAATAFANSASDFASGDSNDGLTQLFIGLDDDTVGIPDILQVGSVDELTNSTLFPTNAFDFNFAAPATLTAATTEANTLYNDGVALATTIAGLPDTDFSTIALDNALSTWDQFIAPDQILAVANIEALLDSLIVSI